MNISIDLTGFAGLAGRLGRKIADAQRNAVYYLAEEVQTRIKLNLEGAVLAVRTGQLLQTWSRAPILVTEPSGNVAATLASKSRYAAIHEFGSDGDGRVPGLPGGVIRPVRARALVFQLADGSWVRTQQVRIPARRYISLAIEYAKARAPNLIRTAIMDAISGRVVA